ncbi:MAG TPA: hypothetical protein VK821_06470 [Dehalococcoidia bacterium]|nr:hypothetical protein [Dehalococcoidia bacterium]
MFVVLSQAKGPNSGLQGSSPGQHVIPGSPQGVTGFGAGMHRLETVHRWPGGQHVLPQTVLFGGHPHPPTSPVTEVLQTIGGAQQIFAPSVPTQTWVLRQQAPLTHWLSGGQQCAFGGAPQTRPPSGQQAPSTHRSPDGQQTPRSWPGIRQIWPVSQHTPGWGPKEPADTHD